MVVDASANGVLLSKSYNEAYEIIERIANNNYQWPTNPEASGIRVVGIHEVDAFTSLAAQLENLLKAYMEKNGALIQGQTATLENLENQVGQLINELRSRPQGVVPNNIENPPPAKSSNNLENLLKHCKVVTLRSGRTLEPNAVEVEDEPMKPKKRIGSTNYARKMSQKNCSVQVKNPPPPYPQRLQNQKQEVQFKKNLDVLKQLHINIPLVEALEQMPNYMKFMKEVLFKKKRLGEVETVALMKECSAFLQNKLSPKMKDLGSFTIPCNIGYSYYGRALCDLGSSINLMPMCVFRQLRIGEVRPTTVTLQLVNRSLSHLKGKIEDILVRVDKFIFLADFIMLDFETDKKVPISLGRPFLATGRMLINVQKDKLSMRVHNDVVTFNVFNAIKSCDEIKECSTVSKMESLVIQELEHISKDLFDSLDLSSQGFNTPKASIEKPPESELNKGRRGLTQSWVFDSGKFKSRWLEARVIYPDSYSYWVSPIERRLKKDEITTITNDDNELILTRTDTSWMISRKFNKDTRKDHFMFLFLDQMLSYFFFLFGYDWYDK
ncbi:bromodomain-containing protein [Gossypium australe]|uniref:Bromodomain-containing protein n=1 Tax=Gossypium australe TaxID=47621 RepID=A0A5B6VD46_9ROSI|nr:bromodomain-containing protein [Gossypium australe]